MSGRLSPQLPSYGRCFAAQLGAIGAAGQSSLQRASVLVVGVGGLGSAITTALILAGVGKIVLVDPQYVQESDFNRNPFARVRDIGRPKVDVIAAAYLGRPHVTVVPLVGRAEEIESMEIAKEVQLVIATPNTVSGRLAVARLATRFRLGHLSAALTDGRQALGGFVTAWVPERPNLACPACHLVPGARLARGESLLATVVSAVGSIAAALAIDLLVASDRAAIVDSANCTSIDVRRRTMDSFRVLSRRDCTCCSRSVPRRMQP